MRRLKDKVATRDGRDRGDCNAIAQYLAVEGASVVVNDASHKEDGDREVTEITHRMVAGRSRSKRMCPENRCRAAVLPRRKMGSAGSTSW
jgi:NAD(P)-dependent dehydrogenase (short-subunit alcohol dehydrogenase family)